MKGIKNNMYSIIINTSFEYGYDLVVVDTFNNNIVIGNVNSYYDDIFNVLDEIKEMISLYEDDLKVKENKKNEIRNKRKNKQK